MINLRTGRLRRWPVECRSLVILLWAFAVPAWSAQVPATAPPAAVEQKTEEPPAAIALTDVIPSSERTLIRFRGILSKLDADNSVEVVEAALPAFAQQLDDWWKLEAETFQQVRSTPRLNDVLWQWRLFEGQITAWNAFLAAASRVRSADAETLDKLTASWQATQLALQDTAPAAVSSKITEVLSEGEAVRRRLEERTAQVVAVQAKLAERLDKLNKIRGEIEAVHEQSTVDLMSRDSPPLWTALFGSEPTRSIARQTSESFAKLYKEAVSYFKFYRMRVFIHVALFSGLVALFLGIRRLSPKTGEATTTAAERVVLKRSFTSALLTALLCAPLIYTGASPQVMRMAITPAVVPMLMLLPAILASRLRVGIYFLTLVFLLDFWRYSLPPQWLLGRLLLLAEALLGILGVCLMLRAQKVELSLRARGPIRSLLHISVALFAGAVVANVMGNLTLGEFLLSPFVRILYLGVLIRLGAVVATTFALMSLRAPIAQLSRTVRERKAAVAASIRRLANLTAAVLWILIGMYNLGLIERAQRALKQVLDLQWKAGAAEISIRDFANFILVLGSAYVLSRVLRFILSEEVFPRFHMPRGVPDALELLSRYGVLLFGFLLALTSAGVNLSQATLAISALGVGIGFGLQNIVNNFVCGLILVFEHPIQVGDFVEVGPHYGQVKSIGFRASLVRNLDGAEVIIPNAELIGNKVINWSLSGGLRRITVQVPVPIGTDSRRVIDILKAVARRQHEVVASPAPHAALEQFGDSSLRFILNCWTRSEGYGNVIQALSLAIDEALQEAGIQIPFRQADVHVHWPETAEVTPESGFEGLQAPDRRRQRG